MPRGGVPFSPEMSGEEMMRLLNQSPYSRYLGEGASRWVYSFMDRFAIKIQMYDDESPNFLEVKAWNLDIDPVDRCFFLKPLAWASDFSWAAFPLAYKRSEVEERREIPMLEAQQMFSKYGLLDDHDGNVLWKDRRGTRWAICDYAD